MNSSNSAENYTAGAAPEENGAGLKAGFWIRLSAILTDTVIVYLLTRLIEQTALMLSCYIPFELSFFILASFYSTTAIALKGRTPGKWLCGLVVMKNNGDKVSWPRAIKRELLGKAGIMVLFPYGITTLLPAKRGSGFMLTILPVFIIIILSLIFLIHYLVKRTTWYDRLSGTYVSVIRDQKRKSQLLVFISVLLLLTILGNEFQNFYSIQKIADSYFPYALSQSDSPERDKDRLVDVSSLSEADAKLYMDWIDKNSRSPESYILDKVSSFQVTIFGEEHETADYLDLFCNMIPELYRKGGIRTIALEVCVHEDNDLIRQLVTSGSYDNQIALEIGRHQPWLVWGGMEYWNILKAVWKLNHSLRPGEEKMEVIGIDSRWDGASFALTRGTEDGKTGPVYEKLRFLRTIHAFPLLLYRDELMAHEIDQEIIKKGRKAIVWVGMAHSLLNCRQNPNAKGRMGFLLNHKYPGRIFQIGLHSRFPSAKSAGWIEKVMGKSQFRQAGFDLRNSPFAALRDSSADIFSLQPEVCLGDITRGYIYLAPCRSIKHTTFIKDFVSPEMFAQEKTYYELITGQRLSGAGEVNSYFVKKIKDLQK